MVLAPDNPPSTSIIITQWSINSTLIIAVTPGATTVNPAYGGRVSVDNTLALTLDNLRKNDSGIYKLSVTTAAEILTGEISLQVIGRCVA